MNRDFLPAVGGALVASKSVRVDFSRARGLRGDDLEDLVRAHHKANDAGGSLALANLPDNLEVILGLMELDQFSSICPSVEEGVKSLSPALPRPSHRVPLTTMQMIAFERDQILAEGSAANPEEEARRKIERVNLCIRYLAPNPKRMTLLPHLAKERGEVDPDRAAAATELDSALVAAAFDRLEGLRVLVRDQENRLRYRSASKARTTIAQILKMWADDANRPRMMEWAESGA
ncbi:MAG: hypothetical protein HY720_26900 [Planctomycetes bacterium]|nr:hypothetical protein [Planctomycetota bacterium]